MDFPFNIILGCERGRLLARPGQLHFQANRSKEDSLLRFELSCPCGHDPGGVQVGENHLRISTLDAILPIMQLVQHKVSDNCSQELG